MDDAPLPGDGSPQPSKSPRKQRLGRGLKHMLGQSASASATKSPDHAADKSPGKTPDKSGDKPDQSDRVTATDTDTEAAPERSPDHAGNMRLVHDDDQPATSPPTVAAKVSKPVMNPTTSADVVEDAVSLFTSYDERFTALSGQLEAACNLLADQRQLEMRRARRSAYIGWSLVALLVLVGMIGLWRAGETIGGQRNEIRQVNTQASILSGQVNASEMRIADMQSQLQAAALDQSQLMSELTDMRNALSKANLVIDQWMQKAHEAQDSQGAQSTDTKTSSAKAE